MNGSPVIRASEIGEYAYCTRAWWLRRVRGLSSANVEALAAGQDVHLKHGSQVGSALGLRRWALLLVGLAALSLVLARLLGGGI